MTDILQRLLEEEQKTELTHFTNEDALKIGMFIINYMKQHNLGSVAVSIEKNKEVVFSHIMDGAMPENMTWCARKRNVVARFGHSSMYVEHEFKSRGKIFELDGLLDPNQHQATGGCIPVFVKNVGMVGTISISGMPSEDDHALAVNAILSVK